MTEPESVTLQTACRLLGGEQPYSEPTVRRMLRDGALDHYGRGQLLRITVESIEDYKAGRRTWQRSARTDRAARGERAESSGKGMGRTSPARRTDRAVVDFPLDRKATKRPRPR